MESVWWDEKVKSAWWDNVEKKPSKKNHKKAVKKQNKVAAEHGLKGTCGTNFGLPVGDTFWCDDNQLGLRTHCVVVSSYEYRCCVDTDGCDDQDDMRPWIFHH